MTYIVISLTHLWSFIKLSWVTAMFANWLSFFHKLVAHRAIIRHTPNVDLDKLRVVQLKEKDLKQLNRNQN